MACIYSEIDPHSEGACFGAPQYPIDTQTPKRYIRKPKSCARVYTLFGMTNSNLLTPLCFTRLKNVGNNTMYTTFAVLTVWHGL